MKRMSMGTIALAIKDIYLRIRCSAMVEYLMPGSYAGQIKDGDYVVKHTLTIVSLSGVGNVYELTHKTEEWVESGNDQNVLNVKTEKWYGAYDHRLRRLVDMDFQRTVAFIPENRSVVLETYAQVAARKSQLSSTLIQAQ
jgi:hypothetical protein